ncbi:helix-turn-helix transcriptional regulator [Bradyrhizobium erythrophlei]|uniref:Helix-turn-helix domain-containing protein n=1 Tax=Bradyrhizobium erythrophlei TaxID=1437360 RepID=A0A1M7TS02_9BRAD|nr:helix-turn-helix domain-containing protein [Bradyrhizobium erythrophlei]SHN73529.1 Helix-turn-helix domain-containing protein [Bradyrhizobium erythrophlei]
MLSPNLDVSALVTEKDAARFLSMSFRTLQAWRSEGKGPPYLKLGRSIRYRMSDLLAWIEKQI